VRYRQDALGRLTRARATKLARGQPLHNGEDRLIQWSPNRSDQVPPDTERSAASGQLTYVRLQRNGKWIELWLFTTLNSKDYSVELLVIGYAQRWQAELHFRSVKTQMKMAELDVCTQEMARRNFMPDCWLIAWFEPSRGKPENGWKEASKPSPSGRRSASCWSASRLGAEASWAAMIGTSNYWRR
jgi:hypothetical protein